MFKWITNFFKRCMNKHRVCVVQLCQWSAYPGGRTPKDGPNSAVEFRENILLPKLREYNTVIVDLNGTRGFSSCFLEEVFGGLLSYYHKEELMKKMKLVSDYSSIEDEAWDYILNPREEFIPSSS